MAKKKETPKSAPKPVEDLAAGLGLPSPPDLTAGAAGQPATIGAPRSFYQKPDVAAFLPPGFTPWEDGDEAQPGVWDPADKARLQSMMRAAGLYPAGSTLAAGRWGREDATALREVLEFANYQGIGDIEEAVRQYASTTQSQGTKVGAPKSPLVLRFANPESVRQVVRKTSMDLMGRRLSDAEEAKIISGFQAQSAAAQRAEYAAGEAGGAATAPMDATTYATAQLEGTEEAGDQRFLSAFDRMAKTFTDTVVEGPTLTGKGGVR